MKFYIDGDQTVITKDDFENLQESPAVFISDKDVASRIIRQQGILYLPVGDLQDINDMLNTGGGGVWPPPLV